MSRAVPFHFNAATTASFLRPYFSPMHLPTRHAPPLPRPAPPSMPRLQLPEHLIPTRAQPLNPTLDSTQITPRHNGIRAHTSLDPRPILRPRHRQRRLPGRGPLGLLVRAGALARHLARPDRLNRIILCLDELALAVVVAALEDRPRPLADQPLRLALNACLCAGRARVEVRDFADARGDEGVFGDGELGEAREELALDVVGWEGAVVEGLEEEAYGFEDVDFRVDERGLQRVAVQEGYHFRQHLQLVHRGLAGFAGKGVSLCGFGHAAAHFFEFVVGHCFEIDAGFTARGLGLFEGFVEFALELFLFA